jgi:peptidoglycan-N-acetylglucosamine deacetylase
LTFDDLPWTGGPQGAKARQAGDARLLETLAKHRAPATGFVNCGKIRGDDSSLRAWLAAGHGLGNHTWHHHSLDVVGARIWLQDVRRCDSTLRTLLGKPVRFFRYPMLRQGATRARRDSAARGLAAIGYRNGHVSIDNSDFIVERPYVRAREAGDARAVAAIATEYVEHMRTMVRHARQVSQRKLGREVAHVLLLHVGQLNADVLDRLLRALKADGAEFISLDTALSDPVYGLPDEYIGPKGLSWLFRIAPIDPADEAWDSAESVRLEAALARFANHRQTDERRF